MEPQTFEFACHTYTRKGNSLKIESHLNEVELVVPVNELEKVLLTENKREAPMAESTQQEVFSAVHDERVFQDRKWGTIQEHGHEVGAWLTIMRSLLSDAESEYTCNSKRGEFGALDEIRKLVAVGVACLEQHGVVPRSPTHFYAMDPNYDVSLADDVNP